MKPQSNLIFFYNFIQNLVKKTRNLRKFVTIADLTRKKKVFLLARFRMFLLDILIQKVSLSKEKNFQLHSQQKKNVINERT